MSDDLFIPEGDAPPMAYFEIPVTLPTGETYTYRVVHKVYGCLVASEEEARVWYSREIAAIRAELCKLGGGTLWWRRRCDIQMAEDFETGTYRWRVLFRLGTTPELPNSFLREHVIPDGGPLPVVNMENSNGIQQ